MPTKSLFLLSVCAVLFFSCKEKEEDGVSSVFNLVSNVNGTASVFSNAGSSVADVTFAGSTVQVHFPPSSTRLIGVMPSLGITEGRASSVCLQIPSMQRQCIPGKDDSDGGFLYSKSVAAQNPVRMDFAPMNHTVAVTVKGGTSQKIHGVLLSSSSAGLAGYATVDLFRASTISAIPGGTKHVSTTLENPSAPGDGATLYLHTALMQCEDVQFRIVMASCYYCVRLSSSNMDFSFQGTTALEVDLDNYRVVINGKTDMGAAVSKSDEGDFRSLLFMDDARPYTEHIPDFSRVGYKYGDAPIPSPEAVAIIDETSIRTALVAGTASDTTDFIQKTIDRVGASGGGAILLKKGTYNVSRILFLDADYVVLRGESEDGTIIKSSSKSQAPIVYMGRSVPKQATDKPGESLAFVAGRRVAISRMKAAGVGGNSSFGSVYITTYSPESPGRVYGSNSVIVEDYVPLGREYVEVRNPALFKPGDPVRIYRQPTQNWLEDIGMTHIASNGRESVGSPSYQWDISTYTMSWTRKVTAVVGSRVYLDAPVVQSLERRYGGGVLQKYKQERIVGCGVENLSFDCCYDKSVVDNGNEIDEAHAWQAVQIKCAEHCWVRNVTSRHMGYSLADMGSGARCITIENCTSLSPVSTISGARRYAYCCSGGAELCLVKDSYCEYDRHSFVTNGTAPGPNVFTNCRSERGLAAIGPHWGWATGVLYDHIQADSNFEAQDGGNQGTGHGWRGVNVVFWNVSSSGKPIVCQNVWGTCPSGHKWNRGPVCSTCGAEVMPSGRNYAVGVKGVKYAHTVYWDKDYYGKPTSDFFVDLYGWGPYEYNRPDGEWFPSRDFTVSGGEFIKLPYEAPVDWWPVLEERNYSQPYSLYQCQLEDRHARGIFLNTL